MVVLQFFVNGPVSFVVGVIIFLGLWKFISCQSCRLSLSDELQFVNEYRESIASCDVGIICEETTVIENPHELPDRYNSFRFCSTWKGRATISNICGATYDAVITSSEQFKYNYHNSLPNVIEFKIIDSACSSIPTFEDFTNIEVIRMHNTNLADISITSHELHTLTLLDLSRNKISNINTIDLSSSSNLQELNVSYNTINTINDQVFRHIPSVKKLDLSFNTIDDITSKKFYGLHNLNILYLSNNKISDINYAFENLIELEEIYLDHNNLQEIKERYFKDLGKLRILKLNYNSITKFEWKAVDYMPLLKMLDVSYNSIQNVKETAFENLELEHVDLSFNNITQLIPNTFQNLHISFFAIHNNKLEAGLEFGMFKGMRMVSELDLSHQLIDAVGDYAFYGLTSLSTLRLNNNRIKIVSKFGFSSLVDLLILDLSNNMLKVIDFDKNELTSLTILRLQINLIENIRPIIFEELPNLAILDLSQNNLSAFNSDAFTQLQRLDISHNSLLNMNDDIFDKFVNLVWLDLSYNSNLTIDLNLSVNNKEELKQFGVANCDLDNVNFLQVHVFKFITNLVLKYNKISKIEYGMFSNNKELIELDLSYNKISHIQPGSFKDNNELTILNVAHNKLLELEYGSFLGLNKLSLLDISFNKIKSLKRGSFFETSNLNTLIADNNSIESVEYDDFFGANISTLSIGGNPLACLFLINLITETHNLQVTSLKNELHLPNFRGITCNPDSNKNDKIGNNLTNTVDNNLYLERREVILEDIRNILLEMKRTNYSKGTATENESSILLQVSNLTDSIRQAFYNTDEANDRLINNIVDPNKNSILAQAYTNVSAIAKNIIKYINKTDETDSKILQLIAKIDENNNSKLVQAYANMSSLFQNIIKYINKNDETNNKITQQIAQINKNSKNNNDLLDYFKNQTMSIRHNQINQPKEIYDSGHSKYVFETKDDMQDSKNVDPNEAMVHFDKFQSNIRELEPTQTKTTLSDVCLVFITVIMLCFMLYKVYELNLLSSLRRRRTASTRNINESIATATL